MVWVAILIAFIIGLTPQVLASDYKKKLGLIMEIDVKHCKPSAYFGFGKRAKCFIYYDDISKKLYVYKNRNNIPRGLGFLCVDKDDMVFIIYDYDCEAIRLKRTIWGDVKLLGRALIKKVTSFLF